LQEGRRKGDRTVGRFLSDTVDAVPRVTKEELEALYTDNVQDVLLIMYLSSLVRTHVALADKLGTAQLPIL
jgi:translation initiation factor 3 subunit F